VSAFALVPVAVVPVTADRAEDDAGVNSVTETLQTINVKT